MMYGDISMDISNIFICGIRKVFEKKKRHIVSIISSHVLLFHHSYSSANAKKWESEFQTLKNNNARLTAALQESAINVEKWKEQLNNYKEDNQRLRKKVIV